MASATAALTGADALVLVLDIAARWGGEQEDMLHRVAVAAGASGAALLLALNKADRLTGGHNVRGLRGRSKVLRAGALRELLERKCDIVAEAWRGAAATHHLHAAADAATSVPLHLMAAVHGEGVEELRVALAALAVPRPWEFPAGVVSDRSNLARVTEAVREQLYRHLHREVPYGARQVNRGWRVNARGELVIHQDILLPRASHARMLTGRGGASLAAVSRGARAALEAAFGRRVHLFLHASVKPGLGARGTAADDDLELSGAAMDAGVAAGAAAPAVRAAPSRLPRAPTARAAAISSAVDALAAEVGAPAPTPSRAVSVAQLAVAADAALLAPHAIWPTARE